MIFLFFILENKMKYEQYIDLCVEEANKSNMKIKVGAILIHRGKVISKGFNYIKRGFIRTKYCLL